MSLTQDRGPATSAEEPGPVASPAADGAPPEAAEIAPYDPVLTIGVTLAVVGGVVSGVDLRAAGLALALGLVAAIVVRPVLAAYLWLGLTPLVVGMDRGSVLPLLRPNEALLAGLLGALALSGVVRWISGRAGRWQITRVDIGFLLLALTGAVLPALLSVARGRGLSLDDLLSAANVVKYYAVYVIVRTTVRSPAQVSRCLWLTLGVSAVVGVIAILQSLRLFGVPELLSTYWATGDDVAALANGRGSSTIGHTQGYADVMVFNLAIATALLLRRRTRRWLVLPLAALFLVGALASGQVSGVVGLLVGVVAVGYAVRRLDTVLLGFVSVLPLAVLLLIPVVLTRLDNLDPRSGLPVSWLARWENLRTYFWPSLFEDDGWILGVQLLPEAAGREEWQPIVWIESGHTWLLWIGGVPLLVAFFVFLGWAVRTSARAARSAAEPMAVAGAASFAAWLTVGAGMIFDPHLFLRGSADLSFPLLALATVAVLTPHDEGGPPARDRADAGPVELDVPNRS